MSKKWLKWKMNKKYMKNGFESWKTAYYRKKARITKTSLKKALNQNSQLLPAIYFLCNQFDLKSLIEENAKWISRIYPHVKFT